MSSRCPNCNEKIKPTYLKPTCPKCGVNMLYFKLDEQLEKDAEKAQKEVDAVNRFVDTIKASTIKSPLHIFRLILFFTQLLSMCLPMYWAGHKNVSLITFIMSIINHGFDFGALISDKSYLFAVLSIVLVILVSIAEIISSLFSSTKKGYNANEIIAVINLLVFYVMSNLVTAFDGRVKIGFFITLLIYALKLILLNVVGNNKKKIISVAIIFVALALLFVNDVKPINTTICPAVEECDVSVVSFNVASAFGTKLEDTDSMDRCDRFATYMNAYSPDFIGTQEINSYWFESLDKSLEGYKSYGVKRGGDSEERNSEMNAVFFKDTFKILEENTFWLSETPDVESKYTYVDANGSEQEAGCNRICTYVVLSDDKNTYLFLNTHLDNSSEEARVFGANVILNKIDDLKKQYGEDARVVLTGDFNENEDNDAYKLISSRLSDTTIDERAFATYQEWGYRSTGDKPIDFIFTNGESDNYWVLNRLDDGYVSDHYGVYSELNFK